MVKIARIDMDILWKPISDSLGYEVSSDGRVRHGNRMLNAAPRRDGYIRVRLYSNKTKTCFFIHRLVAEAFIDRIEDKNIVDHINGLRSDNRVENLRWVSAKENSNFRVFPNYGKRTRRVIQLKMNNEPIKTWESLKGAATSLGIPKTSISNCCRGKIKSCGGWKWKYEDDVLERPEDEEWRTVTVKNKEYTVSSLGYIKTENGSFTKGHKNGLKYLIYDDVLVHRIVAEAFCEKPEENEKLIVNHIDGVRTNNVSTNLEWITQKQSRLHFYKISLNGHEQPKLCKSVISTKDGIDNIYPSATEAQRVTGVSNTCISRVCKGKGYTAGGYKWRYADTPEGVSDSKNVEN